MSPTPTRVTPSIQAVKLIRDHGIPAVVEDDDNVIVIAKRTKEVEKIISEIQKKSKQLYHKSAKIHFIS